MNESSADDFKKRGAAYLARIDALSAAVQLQRSFSLGLTILVVILPAVALGLAWSRLDAKLLFVACVVAALLRLTLRLTWERSLVRKSLARIDRDYPAPERR